MAYQFLEQAFARTPDVPMRSDNVHCQFVGPPLPCVLGPSRVESDLPSFFLIVMDISTLTEAVEPKSLIGAVEPKADVGTHILGYE